MKKGMLKAILSAFVLLTFSVWQTWAGDISTSIFNQGMRLYSRQDYRGAAQYLGQICDMTPDNHQARYYLIYCFLALKQPETALKHARILCEKAPGNQQFISLRDQIAQASSMHAASQAHLKSAIPKEVILGDDGSLEIRHEPRSSRPASATTDKPMSDLESAIAAIDTEQFASAAELLGIILEKDPKNQSALHYRGVADLQQQQYLSAQAWFEKALAVKPDHVETLFLLGDVLLKQGKFKEAEGRFEKALKIRPDDVFTMLKLAETKQRQGQRKAAFELYTRVQKLDSSIVEARLALSEILIDEGRFNEAEATVNEALAADKTNYLAHYLKGRISFGTYEYGNAVDEMKLALSGQPNNIDIKLWLAKSLIRRIEVNECFDLISQVLQVEPDNYDARLVMAEVLIRQGDAAGARAYIDRAGSSPDVTRLQAMLARQLGDDKKAKTYYLQFISEAPNNPHAYFDYADFLEQNNKYYDAVKVLENVIASFPDSGNASFAKSRIEMIEALNAAGAGN